MVKMSKWIRLSEETYSYLVQRGRFKESFDGVVRRLLGLKPKEGTKHA